eukprot:TRINITY_DN539_c0_g4_i1.p1 TRINITY_DN539_c0_g4~~TRINITY_DN539_c0_g4_i1.p1  ORF type:complete len:490 (+),score=155.12 TRINITY_DN539_c0_g4_i1:49-1470(+)
MCIRDSFSYREDDTLGKGQFGYVYKGEDTQTKEKVAIKVVPLHILENQYYGQLLINEVEALKKLRSPSIVRFIDLKMTKNNIYLITEFCDSGDLCAYLEKKTKLTEDEVLDVLKQICEAFKEMKRFNIIHRDLKPANMLIHQGRIKIADMGFAKSVKNFQGSILQSTVGSPIYMSPQLLFKQFYTSKCDVWSLGVILYQLLYGVVPWNALDIVELTNKIRTEKVHFKEGVAISAELKDLIYRCLKYEEKDRLSWDEIFVHAAVTKPSPQRPLPPLDKKSAVEPQQQQAKPAEQRPAEAPINPAQLPRQVAPQNTAAYSPAGQIPIQPQLPPHIGSQQVYPQNVRVPQQPLQVPQHPGVFPQQIPNQQFHPAAAGPYYGQAGLQPQNFAGQGLNSQNYGGLVGAGGFQLQGNQFQARGPAQGGPNQPQSLGSNSGYSNPGFGTNLPGFGSAGNFLQGYNANPYMGNPAAGGWYK